MGIEPTYSAWKAAALPLSYTRFRQRLQNIPKPAQIIGLRRVVKIKLGATVATAKLWHNRLATGGASGPGKQQFDATKTNSL
jgi:hypothetical protein